jgi:PKD repeat protein
MAGGGLRTSAPRASVGSVLLVGVLLAAMLGLWPAQARAATDPLRIMPLGDSITRGTRSSPVEDPVAYRRALWTLLRQHGADMAFVGSQADGSGDFDNRHEAYGGMHAKGGSIPSRESAGLVANVYTWLTANPADVVLLHIGTNDLYGGQSHSGVAAEVGEALDEIARFERDSGRPVAVVLARIINNRDPSSALGQAISQFNERIEALAAARVGQGDDVTIVDMEAALSYPADMADLLHPTDGGYAKMAETWLPAVLQALARLRPEPPQVEVRARPSVGVEPSLRVTFDVTATGATSYAWTFGDGATSTAEAPAHVYEGAGRYTATLVVSGPGGSASASAQVVVESFAVDRDADGVADAMEVLVGADPDDPRDNAGSVSAACPRSAVPSAGFADAAGNTHEAAIDCAAWYRIVSGRSPGTYAVATPTTRGQFATLLGGVLDALPEAVPASGQARFSDTAGDVHEPNIARLAALEVISGFGDGTFRPGEPVTRAQAASFVAGLHRALGLALPAGPAVFDDVRGTHAENIQALAAAGVLLGEGPATFSPGKSIRRDQIASVLARYAALLVEDAGLRPPG